MFVEIRKLTAIVLQHFHIWSNFIRTKLGLLRLVTTSSPGKDKFTEGPPTELDRRDMLPLA